MILKILYLCKQIKWKYYFGSVWVYFLILARFGSAWVYYVKFCHGLGLLKSKFRLGVS